MTGGQRSGPDRTRPVEADAAGLRRILLNALSLFLAYVLPRAFTFISVVVAARMVGASRFGVYGTAAALALILGVLATLGMPPLLIREMARDPERAPELIRSAHRVKTVANAVMLAVLFVLARYVLGYPEPVVAAAMLLGLATAVNAYADNLMAYFQAIERMHVWTQANAANGLVAGAAGVALIVATHSVVWFCAAAVAGQLAGLGWLAARAPAGHRLGTAAPGSHTRGLVRALVPFAAAFTGMAAYYKVDILVLTQLRPAADVGIYTAGYKFIDVIQALVLVFAVAVYPRLSRLAPAARPEQRWAGARLTELALLAAVPAGSLLFLVSGPLVAFVYGSDYLGAVPVVAVLGLVVPALAVNLVAGYVLGARERMRRVAQLYGAGIVLNVALNVALVPLLGPTGAAAAMAASETLLAVAFVLVLGFEAAAAPRTRALVAAAAAALAAVGAGLLPLDAVAAAAVYVAVVAVVYHGAGAVSETEWTALRLAIAGGPGGAARPMADATRS